MATNRTHLTLERIRKMLPPDGKQAVYVFDDDPRCLSVRITPAGSKSFIYSGKLNGAPFRVTIGGVDIWTLEDARTEARRLQTVVDKGIDPRQVEIDKRAAKQSADMEIEAAKTYTLGKLFEAYCSKLDAEGKAKTARTARSLFKTHSGQKLRDTPAKDVIDEDVSDMLRAVVEAGKQRTAGALRTALLAAYNVALRARLDTLIPVHFKEYGVRSNPIAAIPAIANRAEHRVLTNEELRHYLRALGDRPTDQALTIALYAGGQRMEQILRARVRDWNADTQTLRLFDPKGRRQQPRIHDLPIAPLAAAIVAKIAGAAKAAERAELFTLDITTPGKRLKSIFEDAGIKPAPTLRDIRRTVETRMAAMGISKDTRAQVLSHGLGGVQDKHYDMHSYESEKRNALMAWESFLEGIKTDDPTGTNVVPMRSKTAA